MSIIDGPTEIKPKSADKKSLGAVVPPALALRLIREMERLTGIALDPAPAYLFNIEISGKVVGLFTQCNGIGVQRKVETIMEGGMNDTVHQLAGQISYSNIVLSRGMSVSRVLWDWFRTGRYEYDVKRLNISIVQGSPGMNLAAMVTSLAGSGVGVIKRWNIENAFPVSWRLSDLNVSDTSNVAIETLELAHEGISLSPLTGIPML